MLRSWLWLSLLSVVLVVLVVLAVPRAARADQPGGHTVSVAVLGFDSEDAEEQADALTGALRSRVRSASGWSLVATTASIGMLTAGLKCSARPNAECQQRIAEQVKSERYVWGIVTKGPTPGQVTAEVHLYQKGKPDVVFKQTFSDNLRDPNDDRGIGKIATRIVERLGASALGIIVVRAEGTSGEVVLDGQKRVPLTKGAARIEAAPGDHSVEVLAPGGPSTKRNVLVAVGKESVVDMTVASPSAPPGPVEPGKPFPTRKVIGGATMGVGVVLGVVSVVSLAAWMGNKSDGNDLQGEVPRDEKPCDYRRPGKPRVAERQFCDLDEKAKANSTMAWVTGTVGVVALGVGAYLLFADTSKESTPAARYKTRVSPTVGATNGLVLTGSF